MKGKFRLSAIGLLVVTSLIVPSVAFSDEFSDDFSVAADRLNRLFWATVRGAESFLGRTQLRDWESENGVGHFYVADGSARLALDTFNPTGFSLYGTHAKTRVSFQPSPTTDVVLAFRMRLTSLQRGLVYGLYFYGCGASCSTDHDEADIEIVSNFLQAGVSPLRVQLNRYAAEALGAGHGVVVDLPPGFDPLSDHEWKIRWGASRLTYYVDGAVLFSTTTFVPQRPMHADMIVWGPASDWIAAYDPSLQAVNDAGANQTFVALVDRFTVSTILSAPPASDDLIVDFGSAYGIWMLFDDDTSAWVQLHTLSAKSVVTGDLDGNGVDEVIVDFGQPHGIWIYYNNSTWAHLHASTANRIAVGDLDGNGNAELLVDFPGFGIWVWANNASWSQLHLSNSNSIVISDLDGNGKTEAIIDFPGFGIWVWHDNTSWFQLHPLNSRLMAVGDFDGNGKADVIVDFAGYGLWSYANKTSWSQIHSFDASHLAAGDVDGNGQSDLIVDFGSQSGIWMLMNGTTWSQLHTLTSTNIVTGDFDNSGKADVIINFGEAGLWEYVNSTSWIRLHSVSPGAMAVGHINAP